MTNRKRSRFSAFLTLTIAGLVPGVYAQTSAVRSGSFEVGGFVGASYGIDKFHTMGGANLTYALKNKYVLPYFEYSYFPGLPRTTSSGTIVNNDSLAFEDIHGGVHIRMPFFKEKPIVPYAVLGLGALHYPSRTVSVTGTNGGVTITQSVPLPSGTDFTINGGGGIRYYFGQTGTYGIRTEAKVYHIVEGPFSGTTFGKVEVGFFIQLH